MAEKEDIEIGRADDCARQIHDMAYREAKEFLTAFNAGSSCQSERALCASPAMAPGFNSSTKSALRMISFSLLIWLYPLAVGGATTCPPAISTKSAR